MTQPAGQLAAIYITDVGGAAMVAQDTVRAIAGVGLENDRYATKNGAFSTRPGRGREVTLIAREAVAAANSTTSGTDIIGEHETRRNLVTVGIDLDALIGKTFTVGGTVMLGVRNCPPCTYLEGLTRPGVKTALTGGAGLRAEILHGGTLHVGDCIVELEDADEVAALL